MLKPSLFIIWWWRGVDREHSCNFTGCEGLAEVQNLPCIQNLPCNCGEVADACSRPCMNSAATKINEQI